MIDTETNMIDLQSGKFAGLSVLVDGLAVSTLPHVKEGGKWSVVPQNGIIRIHGGISATKAEGVLLYNAFVHQRQCECKQLVIREYHDSGERSWGFSQRPGDFYFNSLLIFQEILGKKNFELAINRHVDEVIQKKQQERIFYTSSPQCAQGAWEGDFLRDKLVKSPSSGGDATEFEGLPYQLADYSSIPGHIIKRYAVWLEVVNQVLQEQGRPIIDISVIFQAKLLSPVVTSAPEASSAPEVRSAPEVSSTPEASSTPVVTSAPEATSAPEVTSAPVASSAPVVTSAPEASSTPEVTSAPVASYAPVATSAPVARSAQGNIPTAEDWAQARSAEDYCGELASIPVQDLASVLQGKPGDFGKKVLVASSMAQGRRLLQSLARKGITLFNVSVETPRSLATAFVQRLSTDKLLSTPQAVELMHQQIKQQESGFFRQHQAETLAVAKELYNVVLELSLEEASSMESAELSGHSRLETMLKLWKDYQSAKEQSSTMDMADLYQLGAVGAKLPQFPHAWGKTQFFCLSSQQFPSLVWKFLKNLAQDRLTVCQVPKQQIADSLAGKQCRFFACRGEETQFRQVFRDILQKGYALEDCAVVYLSSQCASPLFQVGARWNIPVSVSLSLEESLLFSTLKTMDTFAQEEFPLSKLQSLLVSGAVKLKRRGTLERILRKRDMSFGRYLYHSDISTEELPPVKNETEKKALEATLRNWTKFLQVILSMGDQALSVEEQRENIQLFLSDFTQKHRAGEAGAYHSALQLLDQATEICVPGEESVLTVLLELMEDGKYLPSSRSTDLLCLPLSQALFTGREHLYVVDMSRYALEQGGKQSPILLDQEKQEYFPCVPTIDLRAQWREDSFYQLLSCHQGEFIFLYSDINSEKMVSMSPSPAYEEALKVTGVLEEQVDYVAKTALTPGDLSLGQLYTRWSYPVPTLPVPKVAQVDTSKKKDSSATGKVSLRSERSLSERIRQFRFSASSLQDALYCPLQFYLSRIVELQDSQVEEPKENRWLSPSTLGTFVHKVLELYYEQVIQGKNCDLETLYLEEFALLEVMYPCAAENLQLQQWKEEEKALMLQFVQVACDWTANSGHQVLATEQNYGAEEPVLLNVGDRKISFLGTIDRVDEYQGDIHLLDYKTTQVDAFESKAELQLQHYLYTILYEQENPGKKVKSADYFLMRGEAPLYPYEQTTDVRLKYQWKITELLKILSSEVETQIPCPCYQLEEKPGEPGVYVLKTGTVTQRKDAYSSCKRYCKYSAFCEKEMEVLL